jgi:hypothetical protein
MVDEETREVEQPRHPRDDRDHVKRLDPWVRGDQRVDHLPLRPSLPLKEKMKGKEDDEFVGAGGKSNS